MKYTLVGSISRLKKIFDEETKDRNLIDIEDMLKYETVKDVYDRIMKISEKDYNDFSNFVSLLTIEFVNIMCNDYKKNNNISNKQKNALFHISNSNKEDYIKFLYLEEISDLFIILSSIFEEYNFDCKFELEEYPYAYIQDLLSDKDVLNIYKEYHPDFELEMNQFNEYKESIKTYEIISNLKIKGVFSFIYYFSVLKNSIDDRYTLISMFMGKLWEIYSYNEKLYKKILYYLCGYFYSKNKNIKSSDHEIQTLLSAIKYSDGTNLANIDRLDILLNEFINFNLLDFVDSLDEFPKSMKKVMMKISGE